MLGAVAASAAQEPPALDQVLVTAPEPRYVAPTLRDRIGRIWAPVYINGAGPYRLVLDTGASRSALTRTVVEQLGLPPARERFAFLRGVTGGAEVPLVRADQMEMGDLLAEQQVLLVVDDAFGGAEGVLAMRGLRDRRIAVEFRADRIDIARSQGQRAPRGYTVMPVKLLNGHVPIVEARVGPINVRAVIDTGAQQTTGNLALRSALLARRRQLDMREEGVIGVTGDVQIGANVAVPPIRMGEIEIRNARITFLDLYIFEHWKLIDEPAIMIGMDVLGVLDGLILDYRRRELQVRLVRN